MTKKLFIPGPVNVDDDILSEMSRQMVSHRSKEFKELYRNIINKLKKMFETENDIILLTCSATGAMESAIRNVVNANVLCISNGEFAKRWYEIAESNGKKAKLIDFKEGTPYDYDVIEKELRENKYDAVTVVLNESSTGIENDLAPLKKILETMPETLLLVDAVTGLFGTDIDFEGIDVLVSGSQKAIALPPGLAFLMFNKKSYERSENVENRGYYFDFVKNKESTDKDNTLATPAVSLIYALNRQLDKVISTGYTGWINRHKENSRYVRDSFSELGFELFVDEKNKSNTVTVIKNSKNIDVEDMIKYLKTKGFSIVNGYGPLKDKTFRIGHMGVTLDDSKALLSEIRNYLNEKKV